MLASVQTICGLNRRIINFVIVGGSVALFGSIQMYLYVDILHIEQNLAYILQTFLSLQINFNINDRWTWGDWRSGNGKYWHRWIKYHLSRLATVLISQIMFSIMVYLSVQYQMAYATTIVFGFVINYITSSKYVFKILRRTEQNESKG